MKGQVKPEKVVLITGAARRIGAALAEYFHARGFRVVIHFRDSDQAAETLLLRAMLEALQRTSSRELFGAPMNQIPGVQTQLAEMALNIDTSALLIYRAAWTKDCVADRITRVFPVMAVVQVVALMEDEAKVEIETTAVLP